MTGMRKRSSDPKKDQQKIKVNPLYNTSAVLKGAIDNVKRALGGGKKPEKKQKKRK